VDTAEPHLNIVLVEDHDILRHMLKQALEEMGHRVTALACAEELEDEARGTTADIFLIDLNLPGEDGLSLTERVRAAHPLAGLIVVTARSSLQRQEGFTLSQQRMTLSRNGHPATRLNAAETAMLVAFSRAPGQRLAYWQIAETLGLDLQSYPKSSLEVRIVRLRKKLIEAGAETNCIEAVRGQGYQLCMMVQLV
jgi:DNA-binding response OmpR family regulator